MIFLFQVFVSEYVGSMDTKFFESQLGISSYMDFCKYIAFSIRSNKAKI